MKKQIGIFSGGGSMAAHTAGYLSEAKPNYDVTFGTSSGAILAAMSAAGKFDILEEVFTQFTPEIVYKKNPFNKRGKPKVFNTLWTLLRKKKALADSTPLLDTIRKYFTEEDYYRLRQEKRMVIITAVNIDSRPSLVSYFNSKVVSYENFTLAMLASCSYPIAMPPVKIGLNHYSDGGIVEVVPLKYAQDLFPDASKEVFCHFPAIDTRNPVIENNLAENMLSVAINAFNLSRDEIRRNDLSYKDETCNIHYLPYRLSQNAMVFDGQEIQEWFQMGAHLARSVDK
jgi:NTE family protein